MGNKKKYFFAAGFALVIIATYLGLVTRDGNHPGSPVSAYSIPILEISKLTSRAAEGDCTAAERLALYHMNISLRYDDAVRWARIAAKCPVLDYKETLFALLARETEDATVMKEVDSLVLEIEALDPKRSSQLKQVVEDIRAKK